MKWARRTTLARDRLRTPEGLIPPLLPKLVDQVPKGKDWRHEIKWDGYRVGAYLNGGQVRVMTRNLQDWTQKFPTIVKAVSAIDAANAMIDGEAFVASADGLSHFSALQQALGHGGERHSIMFAAFDLLLLNGEDLRDRPLAERIDALHGLLGEAPPEGIVYSDGLDGEAGDIFKHACRFGLEGIVSKRVDSVYRSGRQASWVKTKCIATAEFIVIGYEPGGAFGGLGSLLLANVEDGKLTYCGGVGTGFNSRSAPALKLRLDAIATARPSVPGIKVKGAIWVRPEMVVEIAYRGWTEDHQLRHPSFKGVRDDRSSDEFFEA